MKRFEMNTDSLKEATNYIVNRSIQLLKYNVRLVSIDEVDIGLDATFSYDNEEYHSIYVLSAYRGKGLYKKYVSLNNYKIITHVDCGIFSYLDKNKIPFVCFGTFEKIFEYKLIEDYYGDKKANRSGAYLMNHIDEGLAILNWIGASYNAKRSYTIHPLFQSDNDLRILVGNGLSGEHRDIKSNIIINAMEYRSVANEYLSKRTISDISEIRLSPLKDVNDMLIADKIQNYKDFELYHKDTHPRAKELDEYFNNWLIRLGVQDRYSEFKNRLNTI